MILRGEPETDNRTTVVVGADHAAVLAAGQLPGEVQFLGLSEKVVRHVESEVDHATILSDPACIDGVVDGVDAAVVATPSDSRNFLYAQRLRVDTGVSDVVVRVTDPDNRAVFADLAVEPVCTATHASDSLVEAYERSTF